MSDLPAKSGANGAGRGGPARGYSWPPFEKGNTAALRHGLFAEKFALTGDEEVQEIAAAVRSSLPLYAPNFEVGVQLLAARIWRLQRGYRYVVETPEGERSKAFEEALNALENVVSRTVARLGLDPIGASELGINLKRLAAASEDGQPPFQWNNLDAEERRELERLIGKGRRTPDGD